MKMKLIEAALPLPKATENAIRQLRDPVALNSWTAYAASCQSMDEFAVVLAK
jgi:hypothetical protein